MKTTYKLIVRDFSLWPYEKALSAMQNFVDTRVSNQPDELWLCEHPSVITLGQAALRSDVTVAASVPVVQSDRGGKVTCHNPGQLMLYALFNMQANDLHARSLVSLLESMVIDVLKQMGVSAYADTAAPGVYTERGKIASIGLRIRKGSSYHGIAINVHNDTSLFSSINACGVSNASIDTMSMHQQHVSINWVKQACTEYLAANLGLGWEQLSSDKLHF